MARIDLDLAHAYRPNPQRDEDYALLPLKMRFDDGGAYALLGPSGCGKTTLLNICSGLVTPSQGSVSFDGVDVTRQSPQQRNIAQVFQFPVIYDTMTVAQNLAFPLKNRGVPADRIKQRVGHIAEMLELSAQLDQRASGLAADAKQKDLARPRPGARRCQRGAVRRATDRDRSAPEVAELRRKLKQIHHELKLTLIYVTHDQVEALTFADQVVVMTRGRAVQVGTASDLFERPQHAFVGHFIGSPGMNFFAGALCRRRTARGCAHAADTSRPAGTGRGRQLHARRATRIRVAGRSRRSAGLAGDGDAAPGCGYLLAAQRRASTAMCCARVSKPMPMCSTDRRIGSGCRSPAPTPATTAATKR